METRRPSLQSMIHDDVILGRGYSAHGVMDR